MDEPPDGAPDVVGDEGEDERSDESPSSSSIDVRPKQQIRRKRGKYRKYPMELKREIGHYAREHGKQNAIDYFTSTLGYTLSESTVRHFVRLCGDGSPPPSTPPGLIRRKSRLVYSREFRAQVGEFAAEYGNSKAREHFESNLGVRVPESTIRDMKKWYETRSEKQTSGDSENGDASPRPKKRNREPGKKNSRLSPEQRIVIADFALKHGNTEAVRFFARYGMDVSESTVRSFKRRFSRVEGLEDHPESCLVRAVKAGYFEDKLEELFSCQEDSTEEEAFHGSVQPVTIVPVPVAIPATQVTIQLINSPHPKNAPDKLILPIPDVTIERVKSVTSTAAGTDDFHENYDDDERKLEEDLMRRAEEEERKLQEEEKLAVAVDPDEELKRRREEEDRETREAALRLLELASGFGLRRLPVEVKEEPRSAVELEAKTKIKSGSIVERFRRKYTQDLKFEIGHYALIHGVSCARRVYSERMGRLLPRTSVRDMMVKYQVRHGLANLPALNPVNVS